MPLANSDMKAGRWAKRAKGRKLFARIIAYGWRAEKHGILAFGNTRQQALDQWRESYMAEYFDV